MGGGLSLLLGTRIGTWIETWIGVLDGSTKTHPSQNTSIHNCVVVCHWELKGGGTGGFSEAMLLELQ